MGSMSELWDERQIQILLLLSFTLQVFLFFTGSVRHRNTNMFLRFLLWITYLGADSVAVYVLGLLSRQQDGIRPLAFVWAPFLLIHLGGQDTITAFAIEDNNLWLRHFLNLVVQVALALYVFWKSSVWHNMHLLATGIFVFLAGIIKYGERTMALKYGTLNSLESFTADDNKLPQQTLGTSQHVKYPDVVRTALNSVVGVRDVFGGRTILQMNGVHRNAFRRFHQIQSWDLSLKVLEVELKLIYDDLYSKALVLRTRSGIIFRCVSQVSIVVALVIFTISDKQRYSKADVAITYTLFVGGICLEVCAALMFLMSAWTWGWLQTPNGRNYRWFAGISWYLLSSRIALPEKRNLWSNSMGHYDLVSYAGQYDGKSMSWKQRLMKMIRAMVNFAGVGKGTLFWFSKLLDTVDVTMDREIMKLLSQGIHNYSSASSAPRDFLNLSPALSKIEQLFGSDFGRTVVFLHMFTAVHLSKYPSPPPSSDMDANNPAEGTKQTDTVEVCRKLSNYMLYLFVTHPEMLPSNGSTEATLETFLERVITTDGSSDIDDSNNGSDILLRKASAALNRKWHIPEILPCKETLEEIRDIWIRLIIYMAGKSRPEMHAARLARGGELFTFAWLLMLHNELGDTGTKRIELCGRQGNVDYVYHVHNSRGTSA